MLRTIAFRIAFAAMLAAPAFPQLNRGTITGTVTDAAGAVVPGIKVTLRNTATNASYQTATTETGQYTMPNLPPGPYEVACEASGFKRAVRENISLGATAVVRVDVRLEIGQATESISITAEVPRVQTDSPEVGATLSSKSLLDLPLSFGSARYAEDFAFKIAPGIQGTAFKTRVNGGTEMSKEVLLDGESVSTLRSGHFQESSVSVEALSEFKVQTSGISAEYGRTQGGVMNFVMKSGTNQVHGSAFGGLRNEALNANTFANNFRGADRPQDRRQTYAFSFGGPVYVPKVYNGRNRTFFYTAFEQFRQREFGFGAPNRTAPLPEFYDGDFSRLLGPVIPQKDALNRDVLRGSIYDPATFRQVAGGRWIGDMFPGNRVPASRFSQTSRNFNELVKKEYLPTVRDASGQIPLTNNMLFPVTGSPTFDQYQFSVKGDQNISTSHKLSGSGSVTRRPRLLTDQGGLWNTNEKEGGTFSKARRQDINSALGRLAYDWTVSPSMLNYMSVSFNRMTEFARTVHVDKDGAAVLGIRGLKTEGYPVVNWGGGPFVGLDTPGYQQYVFNAWNSWGFRETLTVNRRKHTVKFGVDLRRNQLNYQLGNATSFNFNALSTAIPNEPFSGNQTGYAFASYLLGIVHSGGGPNDRLVTGVRYHYTSLFVNDDFKVSPRLTLQLGLRWEYSPPMFETANRMATWSQTAIDPESKLPGAYTFAGSCQLCTGQRYFGVRDFNNFGPRVGFAFRATNRWTVRGSYGIFYEADLPGGQPLSTAWLFPWIGTWNMAADPVTPWAGIFNWDTGFPLNRYVPGAFDQSYGNRNRPTMVDPGYGLTPYTQQWSLNLQREVLPRLILDVGYIGNKSTRLRNNELVHINQLNPSALRQYGANLTRAVTSPGEAAANGVAYPYAGFRGTVASALRQFPQVQGNQTVNPYGSPEGMSSYHSLQIVLNKEFSRGLNAYMNYVWSKGLTNTVSSATARGDQLSMLDYYNRGLEKTYSSGDVPHAFKAYVAYELPVGRGRALLGSAHPLVSGILGGWAVSAILNYNSGLPLRFSASSPTSAWNGGTNRPLIAAGDLTQPFERSQFDLANASVPGRNIRLDRSKFADPGPLALGTGAPSYNSVREFPVMNEDLALQKNIRVAEDVRVQLRAEFLNAFNRSRLGGPVTGVTNVLFGQVTSIGGNRQIQIGARLDF